MEQVKFFEQHVRPLLVKKCFKCHGEEKQSGNLRVDSRGGLLAGGDSGPSIELGQPDESLLMEAVRYESYEMPPDGKLSDEQIDVLAKWVSIGAPWPGDDGTAPVRHLQSKITDEDREYWCFQPLRHSAPPVAAADHWSRTPIDRFIWAQLCDAQLSPQPEADRLTLIRRATELVTGLPPSLAEVDAFLSDDAPQAYEQLIDRLLESPRRGEHLARFWLDLVRYAESDGYRADSFRPTAWRYRDYVIDAFNSDKPYDQFVSEQLAGDELDPGNPAALAATGFFRHGIYEYNQRDAETQWKTMQEDITDTTADTFLALGMGCAKCHDHKFDPILQSDYYQLQAFFSNIGPRDQVPLATPEEIASHREQQAHWETATAEIRDELRAMEQPKLDSMAAGAVKMFVPELQAIWHKPDEDRTAYERQIAWLIDEQVRSAQARLDDKFKEEAKVQRDALLARLKEFDNIKPQPLPVGRTITDIADTPTPLLIPGKSRLGEMVPAFLAVLDEPPPVIEPPPAAPHSSGRRAALARWMTRPEHPLTSRVMVNRIWQQCFGTGLVATPSDFGRLGECPSHPELLDWLATEFVSHGWSIKWLQKQILLSAAFRQASLPIAGDTASPPSGSFAAAFMSDPGNRLLWHFPTRRLAAEQIRDAMLSASGELDLTAGGAGSDYNSHRRSVYVKVLRNSHEDLLDVFDFPDRITSSGERNVTTTPTQQLLMINSDFTVQRASALARRVSKEVAGGDDSRIRQAYRLTLGRDPGEKELLRAAEFLQKRRDADGTSPASLVTRSMLLTGSPAAAIADAADRPPLVASNSAQLRQGDFTFEGTVLLSNLYPDATVRTIISKWNADTRHPGWALGVTSEKSRYKPRNLILQLVGKATDGATHYEVIPSDIHLELNRPYYIACRVKLDDTSPAGVTFIVRDLVNPKSEVRTANVGHQVVTGIDNDHPIILGGRANNARHRWDGLLDDVRLTASAMSPTAILADVMRPVSANELSTTGDIVGQWSFNSTSDRGQDQSRQGHSLTLLGESPNGRADQPLVDFCHVLLNSNEFLYLD
ncbi:MAG: DUF1553 domain-containing protein [Planctomycetaceae bacterium]